MQLAYNITDEQKDRLINAVIESNILNRPPQRPGGTTDAQWAKELVRLWLVHITKSYEQRIAGQTAIEAIEVPDDLII